MSAEEVMCAHRVYRGWGIDSACGRKSKGAREGKLLCGLHLRTWDERDRREAEAEEKRHARQAERSRKAALRDRLASAGITVDGELRLTEEEAERVIALLVEW